MKRYQWFLLLALVVLGWITCLAGCNTIRGVGKDIHDSAQNIQLEIEQSDENYVHVDPEVRYESRR